MILALLTFSAAADFRRVEILEEKLGAVKFFDWEAETSPLSAIGGMKGVSKAYELLSLALDQKKDSLSTEQSLTNFTSENLS